MLLFLRVYESWYFQSQSDGVALAFGLSQDLMRCNGRCMLLVIITSALEAQLVETKLRLLCTATEICGCWRINGKFCDRRKDAWTRAVMSFSA